MEAEDGEGEPRQELGQHRQQVSLRNPLTGGHQLPLGNPIDRVDMVEPLDAIEIALMDAIDADEARAALGVWGATLANGNLRGAGLGPVLAAGGVAGDLAQVVQVCH